MQVSSTRRENPYLANHALYSITVHNNSNCSPSARSTPNAHKKIRPVMSNSGQAGSIERLYVLVFTGLSLYLTLSNNRLVPAVELPVTTVLYCLY